MNNNENILTKAKNIKLLACDIDGVLTRGEIIIFNSGEEVKVWNVKDGMGFHILLRTIPRIKTAWITASKQTIQIERRAEELKIDYLVLNCIHKRKALEKIVIENGFNMSEIAYIGDDIMDLPVLKVVGFSICPKDASKDVKKSVDYISYFNGGYGVVREIIEIVMKAKNEWYRAFKM
jgi:YrbI family 3-deoxy-D-manno-octulosonate 8-phosphate phosphatase